MDTACMFLNNLSVVDHAYIDQYGGIIGGSFNPSFLVEGDIDPIEKVVVDFSTIKKDIKKIIDDRDYGFDHKLWFIEGFSQGTCEIEDGRVNLETNHAILNLPLDAIKIIKGKNPSYETRWIGDVFAAHVREHLLPKYKNIKVYCNNNIDAHLYDSRSKNISYFSYVHGLKDSTSYGCQNIAHGHLSYVQLFSEQNQSPQVLGLQSKIASDLNGMIFIKHENLIADTGSQFEIGYKTSQRGNFYAKIYGQRYIVLETETTIEFLADYIKNKYNKELIQVGCTSFFVSEGLSKGAYQQIAV